jgi:peroxiredoxin
MAQFESRRNDIESSGAQVVFIAAERRHGIFRPEKFLREHSISFPFLLDEDRRTAKAYGVHRVIGLDAFNIARPATFIVVPGAVVQFAHLGANQLDRVPVDEILNEVRAA